MFQTEPVLFLQSFSCGILNYFFRWITSLGYNWFLIGFILIITFGVSYRKGYLLVQIALWNGIATMWLKDFFALPRPVQVDARVLDLETGLSNQAKLEAMGARKFFNRLPSEAVEHVRSLHPESYGFPSGHTSTAVTLWGSTGFLFKKKWIRIFCIILIVFIPLSRLYLGRHFLADILGGYALGLIFLILFHLLVFRNRRLQDFLFRDHPFKKPDLPSLIFLAYSALPIILIALPNIDREQTSSLLGLNLGFLAVWLRGVPDDRAPALHRAARIGIAVFILGGCRLFFNQAAQWFPFFKAPEGEFLSTAFSVFILIWGTVEISLKMKLMTRSALP